MTEFRNIFEEEIEVPKVVLEKAEDAFEKIKREEPETVKRKTFLRKGSFRGQAAAAAAVLCALLLGGGAAYAAGHFGMLDFLGRLREQIPKEAENLIETVEDQKILSETDASIMDCQVKEALCDSEVITIVYEVSAKEKNKYLFVPTDALPEDHMSDWSSITGKTAAEYAAEKGLTIVNIGGGIQNKEELGIFTSSMDFRSVSDDVMDIYVRSGKDTDVKNLEVSCVATAVVSGSDEVMKQVVQFTLEDKATSEQAVYIPEEGQEDNGIYTIRRAEVRQTDLGTYIDIFYTVEDPEAKEGLFFQAVNETGALEFVEGSSGEPQEDGSFRERIVLNKTEIGESFILEGYNPFEDKTAYDQTVMVKE